MIDINEILKQTSHKDYKEKIRILCNEILCLRTENKKLKERTESNDTVSLFSHVSNLLETIARTDPQQPLPRIVRDKLHILRGRLLENFSEESTLCQHCNTNVPPDYHNPSCPKWKVGDL